MMDLFIVPSYDCQRNMTKIWAGMTEQLFDLVLVQYLIYLARELVLSLAYASSNKISLFPNKSDTGHKLTK